MKVFLILMGLGQAPDVAFTYYLSVADCAVARDNLTSGRWAGRPIQAECRDTMTGLQWTNIHF